MLSLNRKVAALALTLGLLAACGGGQDSSSAGSTTSDLEGRANAMSIAARADATGGPTSLPASNRVTINLGATPWRYLSGGLDVAKATDPKYDDSATNTTELWRSVGVPQSPSDNETFLNTMSGGGQGQLVSDHLWYRKHFTLDASYSNRKVFVEFEGANIGTRVYINGQFLPGNSLVNPQATHVGGFQAFIVDLTPYVKFDGSDNVMAVNVSRGDSFFAADNVSGAFRFGQGDGGLFRPVWMTITDRVRIPQNTWSVLNTWGTYVTTLSADDNAASVRVQTNVRNEYATTQNVTLTTQIVDATGTVVASMQETKAVASNPLPLVPAKLPADAAQPPATFDQTLTVPKPTLWYPNDSIYGKPYLYKVLHTVSIDGTVVDATQTPLGIRTIVWDQNFPIINGHPHYLWGASGRYDYPALGSAVPEEQVWRDVGLLAAAGGSLWRPGHSSQGPEFLAAGDAFGVMTIQPSGDGENGFAVICAGTGSTRAPGCNANADDVTLKRETHRDMIVHDRNNPSVLAWEADNGSTDTSFAQGIKVLSRVWEPVNTRAQADRTPNPANGDILGCSGDGCDVGVKQQFPNSPSFGAEYWGDGVGRFKYDFELAFAAQYLNNWSNSVRIKSFGINHWYLADTPGEINTQTDGTPNTSVRSNGASMMDANRIPRLLYFAYQAAWTPYQVKPVVKLAHHWNRGGSSAPVVVNAFSNCPAVRLLLNGQPVGGDQVPNPPTIDASSDLTQATTVLPAQVHWSVTWAAGTLTAQCLDGGRVVNDATGAPVIDQLVTAGAADHIQLSVEPALVRPGGAPFQVSANGSDAAFVLATVVDATNNRVPDAQQVLTFAVTGPGTYRGGTDHYVTAGQPESFHAPGDTHLMAEGGMAKVAVRAQFTPGTVTVTATAPGLKTGSVSFDVKATIGPTVSGSSLVIPAQPATALSIVSAPASQTVTIGQTAQFSVLAAGAAPLSFQWTRNGANIAGATSSSYTTAATSASDSGASYAVVVSNNKQSATLTSSAAVLTVVPPSVPSIVSSPADASVVAGQSAQFNVTATGSPVLTYQWLKNGVPIAGAVSTGSAGSTYTTPVLTVADSGSNYSAQVSNSAGQAVSGTAKLTVGAGAAPRILSQPRSAAVAEGQAISFSVLASGAAPLHYQWQRDGAPVGTDDSTLVLSAVQSSDAGSYTVVVKNAISSLVSDPAVLSVSGGNGPDLARGQPSFESSEQNPGLASQYAFDSDLTVSRWASAGGIDQSWISVDLGGSKSINRVVLRWEAAYAAAYEIQVSDTNNGTDWVRVAAQANGHGGVETVDFPTVTKRYVRMYGTQRAPGSTYGYSLFDFGVYNVPQCGGASERYTTQAARSGTYVSTIPGLPSGPYVPTVLDNQTSLDWQQYVTTFPQAGAQFTQTIAANYCSSIGMRLPTQAEALSIAANNYARCAFPNPWTTWTSTAVPNQSGRAWFVSSAGVSSSQIIDNSPGWALCVSANSTGPTTTAPTITTQPASLTVAPGQAASLAVVATGTAPLHYQWKLNGNSVGTDASTYVIASAQSTDAGNYAVTVSNALGSVTSNVAVVTVSTTTGPTINLAAGRPTFESSEENAGLNSRFAVDGDAGTRWASASGIDPSWITVDLGTSRLVSSVVLAWENAYAIAYEIRTSNDNANWTIVAAQTAGVGGAETLTLPAGTTARYVRMFGQRRGTGYGYSLYEFKVLGPSTSTDNAPNLAAGKPSFESSEQDVTLNSRFAFDADPLSRWASVGGIDNSWISVDLGSMQSVSRVVLKWENAYAASYDIQVSSDSINYTPVASKTMGGGGTETITFAPVTTRYVRMQGKQRATAYGYSIYDFQVYASP